MDAPYYCSCICPKHISVTPQLMMSFWMSNSEGFVHIFTHTWYSFIKDMFLLIKTKQELNLKPNIESKYDLIWIFQSCYFKANLQGAGLIWAFAETFLGPYTIWIILAWLNVLNQLKSVRFKQIRSFVHDNMLLHCNISLNILFN